MLRAIRSHRSLPAAPRGNLATNTSLLLCRTSAGRRTYALRTYRRAGMDDIGIL